MGLRVGNSLKGHFAFVMVSGMALFLPDELLAEPLVGEVMPLITAKAMPDPVVEITHPNGTVCKIDCANFIVRGNKIYLTSEAITQIDSNHTTVQGTYTKAEMEQAQKNDLKNKTKTFEQMSSKNTYLFIVHLARAHKDCVVIAAKFEEKVWTKEKLDEIKAAKGKVSKGDLEKAKQFAQAKVDKIYTNLYGPNWKTIKTATLLDVNKAVKAAMQLEK